jgi:hypothetical protein
MVMVMVMMMMMIHTHMWLFENLMLTMMGVAAHSADRSWYCHDDGKTSDWSDGTDVDDKKIKRMIITFCSDPRHSCL